MTNVMRLFAVVRPVNPFGPVFERCAADGEGVNLTRQHLERERVGKTRYLGFRAESAPASNIRVSYIPPAFQGAAPLFPGRSE